MNAKKLIPVLAAAAAIAASASSTGHAGLVEPLPFDSCLTQAPDAALWLGSNTPRVEVSSTSVWPEVEYPETESVSPGGIAYGYRGCKKFIVDLQVPSNSSGGPGFRPAFSIGATPPVFDSGGWCDVFGQLTSVYRKNAGQSTFTHLGGRAKVGSSDPAGGDCVLSVYTGPGADAPYPASFLPPKARYATYRVLSFGYFAGGWLGTYFAPQTVWAAHLPTLGL
jgi:hypothetical protein